MQVITKLQPYFNRRLLVIFLFGFSSGLPFSLISSTLQAWYAVAGVNLLTIGLLSLTQQPYSYKPLWAPIMDRFIPFNLGRRRSWILTAQFCLMLSLTTMAWLNPATSPLLLAGIALLVGFFSASQDIAVDAYRTDLLLPEERGMGAANYVLGWRLAMLTSGAIALIIAATVGWRITYLIMAFIMGMEMWVTWRAPNPAQQPAPPATLKKAVVEPLLDFLTRKDAVIILMFIVTCKLSDGLGLSLNTAFLIRGVGFSLIDVGSIAKIVGTIAVLAGSIIGGILVPRIGLYSSLITFGFLQSFSYLAYISLTVFGKSYLLMSTAIATEYFCSGLSSVALVVFLTSLCNARFTATQYALFSSIEALPRIFMGPVAAIMVTSMGWTQFYIWTALAGMPALFLLWWLRHHIHSADYRLLTA